ncbi:uncharacterized protein LOC144161556 [Haemaphysalis longicornis]
MGKFAGLVGPTRARYEEKVNMCDGVDPYTLCAGTDTTADVELLPVTTHADIVNYLVLSTNYVSLAEMKAYKALEAHNYFTSGRVSGMTAMRLPSKRVIVLSEVGHSQRLREAPLKAWILADSDGSICSAQCTCMAGAGAACSHVGATRFAMETAVRIRESQTCTQKTNVWLPAHRSGTEYKRLRDIDFAPSKKKKSRMDALPEMPFDEQAHDDREAYSDDHESRTVYGCPWRRPPVTLQSPARVLVNGGLSRDACTRRLRVVGSLSRGCWVEKAQLYRVAVARPTGVAGSVVQGRLKKLGRVAIPVLRGELEAGSSAAAPQSMLQAPASFDRRDRLLAVLNSKDGGCEGGAGTL